MVRNKGETEEKEKKKAGYVVVHLGQYKGGKEIELELEIKDCIVKDATISLKFEYEKIEDPDKSPGKD